MVYSSGGLLLGVLQEIHPMQQPTLETARLLLRPFIVTDAPTVQRLAGVFAVADTTLNIPHPYPDGVAEAWIATHPGHFAARTAVIFAMMLREPSALCGSISLAITEHHLHAELGYWLGQPYWNRGYTTEAAAAVQAYGFTMLGLHRIHARHFTRNPASGRVMQKLGMRREGIQREHVRKGDRFEDLVTYGILRQEWSPT
jgi:ribosomal-protein-alanine N-acetyltransferase